MGKGTRTSKKATAGAVGTSVSFHKVIFKRSKAKKAVNGAMKGSCPMLAKAAKGLAVPIKKPTSNPLKGVFGEHLSDIFMNSLGHTKLNGALTKIGDSPIGNGIDGVWKGKNPPPDYIITETKYGSSGLGDTQDGVQMSNKWITKRLNSACTNKKDALDVKKKMSKKPKDVEKWIIHVDDNGVKSIQKLK